MKKVYVWNTKDFSRFIPSLIDHGKCHFAGFVCPGDEVILPEGYRGYPVISSDILKNIKYDYLIADNDSVENYVDEKDKIIRIDQSLSILSLYISPETYYIKRKVRYDISSGMRFDGIITGMSYIQRGLVTEKLDLRMALLAAPAQDLFYDREMLKKYYGQLNDGNGFEYAILGISPYEFRYDESKSEANHWRCLCYYDEVQDLHNFHIDENALSLYLDEERKLREIMQPGYNYHLADIYTDFPWNYSREKFRLENLSEERRKEELNNLDKIADKPYVESIEENTGIFRDYLEFCRLHSIKLIVVLPSFSKLFKSRFPREIVDETQRIVETMQKEYDFAFLNLYDDEDFIEDEHFADVDHLNVFGAEIMTEKVNEIIACM